jgi:hypothetical protein
MKRYFGIFVALAFVVVAIVFASRKWTEKTTEAQRTENLLRLQRDYFERVAWLREVPDQKAYANEMDTFLHWYFKEVNEHFNKFGGNREFTDYLTELDERGGKGGKKEERAGEKKAVYEYTRNVFDQMRKGTYAPFWTGTDKGVRLDILSANTQSVGGESKIHLPVVVWGLPREERVDDHGVKKISVNGSFRFNWKLFDEKQKLIAEIPGEGGPDSRVDWPERYVKFFPAATVLGHYDIDKLPPETKTVEITFTLSARSPSGGDVMANYSWKLDAPAEWKLGAGEAWKGAQESIRPEEEIDPAAAAKKKK